MKYMFPGKKMMVKNNLKSSLLFAVLLFLSSLAVAQPAIDSSCLLPQEIEKNATADSNPYNVVFPEILKGHEGQSMGYIEKFSTRRRDYIMRMYTKGKSLLQKAAGVFKKYDVPEEFRVLLALESAYDGNAVSRAGAVGYWQFMTPVAKEYGLKCATHLSKAEKKQLVKKYRKKANAMIKAMARQKDDRKNFDKSTIAAARYLRDRKLNLNEDWLLVVASYNYGVGNVWNAMERTRKENPTFWDIKKYLPAETQAYVMNFITLNVIFNNYDNFLKNKLVFTTEKTEEADDSFEKNINETISEQVASGIK